MRTTARNGAMAAQALLLALGIAAVAAHPGFAAAEGPASTQPAADRTSRNHIAPQALPPAPAFNGKPLGLKDCRGALDYAPDTVLVFCHNPRQDRRGNFGLRLVLVRGSASDAHILYSAPVGGGDAYSAKPTVFDLGAPSRARVILLDHGAEFHYGTQVFFISADASPRLAGQIDWVTEDDGQVTSPTPHATLTVAGNKILIGFDRKLFKPRRDGSAGPVRNVHFSYDAEKRRWRQF